MSTTAPESPATPASTGERTLQNGDWELTLGGSPHLAFLPDRGAVILTPIYSLLWRGFDECHWSVFSFEADGATRAWIVSREDNMDPDDYSRSYQGSAWEAPRVVLDPPDISALGSPAEVYQRLLSGFALEQSRFKSQEGPETLNSTPLNELSEPCAEWAHAAVMKSTTAELFLIDPAIPAAFATFHSHTSSTEEICDESGPVDWWDHRDDTWRWRIGFWASLHGRRSLLFVDTSSSDSDDDRSPRFSERLHRAILHRDLQFRIGVVVTHSTTAADIVATESDILWLATSSPSLS